MSVRNISVSNEFDYIFKGSVEIADVIEALQGYEYLSLKYIPDALRSLLDIDNLDIKIYLDRITNGSLKNRLTYDITFNTEENYENFVNKVRSYTGLQDISEGNMIGWIKATISVFVFASLLFGAAVIYEQIRPGEGKTIIDNSINVTIKDSNINLGYTGDEVINTIDAIYQKDRNKKETIKNVQKTLSPSQKYGGTIELDSDLTIPENVIEKIPQNFEFKDTQDFTESFNNVRIDIRATDADRYKQGWSVLLPDLYDDKRTQMHIAEDINLNELKQHSIIYGNIIIHKTLKSGDPHSKVTKIELLSYTLPE